MKDRYGWYGINGLWYVYDRKNHNIPMGYSQGYKTKSDAMAEAKKLNQKRVDKGEK